MRLTKGQRYARAFVVTAAALGAGAISSISLGVNPGLAVGGFVGAVLTLLTVPSDQGPGERDIFGAIVLALYLAVSIFALSSERPPAPVYEKYDDPN
jgi:hypothetical protein